MCEGLATYKGTDLELLCLFEPKGLVNLASGKEIVNVVEAF